ncbi:MAG: phage terminase large subunit, partial [Candidatus Bathyarchaeia archaeon]
GIRVSALSSMQQTRGKRFKEFRPTLIILDDIEPDNHVIITPEKTDRLHFWLTRTIQNIGTPGVTNIFLLGTIHSYYSLLARFTEEDKYPDWDKHIYKAIISESDNSQVREQWKRIYCGQEDYCDATGPIAATRFYEDNKTAFLEGSKTIWPAKFDYYTLNVKREEIGEDSFNAEYQNSPSDPTEASFDMKEVRFLEDTYKSEIELFQIRDKFLTFYAGCDWSSGKHALSGDYSAIVVLAKDSETNVMYVVCADIARRRTSKILDDIISYCKVWPIRKFAIETNQAQDILADLLQERLRKEDLNTEVVRVLQGGDKKERIHNLQPLINTARLVFSKRHHLLLEQLKYFPRGRHEDGLDALEMAVRLAGCKKAFNPDEYVKLLKACKGDLPNKNPNKFFIQGGKFIPNPFGLLKVK